MKENESVTNCLGVYNIYQDILTEKPVAGKSLAQQVRRHFDEKVSPFRRPSYVLRKIQANASENDKKMEQDLKKWTFNPLYLSDWMLGLLFISTLGRQSLLSEEKEEKENGGADDDNCEDDDDYAGDHEKGTWSHRSRHVKHSQQQQGQQYQQEQQKQQDLQHQGQHQQHPMQGQQNQKQKQGQQDLQRREQKDQLDQRQHELQQDQQPERGQEDQSQQQRYVPVYHYAKSTGFLISMFLLPPLASAQCSTCLGGRCYDTGQCILGCEPGYMNQYCDEACPSNCLNNDCELNTTTATITCTIGCRAGYCGTKCTRPCPEGCVTCDRQCGSCNKTFCPKRRYGKGCRSVCSPFYEKCDRETGECIKCRQGYYGDNCDRKCPKCFSRGRNLMHKCLSGCKVCKEQDPCPNGLFGANCERECSGKCGKSQETAAHPCNRATGECSAGCVSGYHGLNCNYTCSEHCLSGRCYRATGECSTGCMPGYHGLTCNYNCNEFCESGLCNKHDGTCASGCVSGYTQTSKSCEMLQDTGDKGAPFSNTLLIILIICVVSVQILSLVTFLYTRKLIRRYPVLPVQAL